MTAIDFVEKKPTPVALSLELLGGAALIITTQLTSKGSIIYVPYTTLVIATFFTLRLANWPEFSKRFTAAFLSFMLATIILYLFIGIYDAGTISQIAVPGHIWRLGFMAIIGAVLSGAISYLADIGRVPEE